MPFRNILTPAKKGSKWIRPEKRQAIYNRDERRCVYCDLQSYKLTLDHLVPPALGGTNESRNLVTACVACNSAKQQKTTRQFLRALREKGVETEEIAKRIRRNLRRKLRNYKEGKCNGNGNS